MVGTRVRTYARTHARTHMTYMDDDAACVGHVAHDGAEEHQNAEPLDGASADVFDHLRDARAQVDGGGHPANRNAHVLVNNKKKLIVVVVGG